MRPFVPLFALALLAAGCGEKPAPPAGDAAPARQPAVLSFETPAPPPAGGMAPAGGGQLLFELPAGWVSTPPSSSMRLAQAQIPGPGGEGDLVVFWFGEGGGGGVEDNLQRWIGQMEVAPGTEPRREKLEVDGLAVTWVDVSGTLLPSNMGTGPATPQPGSRLFGAVIEGPGGPWFFKATGPEATLAAEREAFVALLKGARLRPNS